MEVVWINGDAIKQGTKDPVEDTTDEFNDGVVDISNDLVGIARGEELKVGTRFSLFDCQGSEALTLSPFIF